MTLAGDAFVVSAEPEDARALPVASSLCAAA